MPGTEFVADFTFSLHTGSCWCESFSNLIHLCYISVAVIERIPSS
jgi:hypothetical protein